MKNFFLNQNLDPFFSIFSKYHIGLVIITFLIVGLIINNKKKFVDMNDKGKKTLRFTLALILILNFILRRGSIIYYNVYNWKYHLDINFCNFTSILFLAYCLTGNKKIYTICYFMAFIGPLLSIFFPGANLSFFNYSFYSFIILHNLIFIFNIIFMFTEKVDYNNSDLKEVILFLISYFSSIYLFDYIFKTDYNMPLTFLNKIILKNDIINYFLNIKYIEYFGMFIIVSCNIYLAKKINQFLNHKS